MVIKCSETVYDPTGWGHSYACSRNGKVEEDSKWWCKQHAPSSVKARSEAASARWQADQDSRNAPYEEADRLRAVNAKLVEALIQCIDHPITGYERQLAREAIEEARK